MGASASIAGTARAAREVADVILPAPPIIKAPAPPNMAADPTAADAAAERARRKAAASEGRSSTILTGPSGVTGDAAGQRKTLLGA